MPPLLSLLYNSNSTDEMLNLVDLFLIFAQIRYALSDATNELRCYNQAAIKLRYVRKIINSKGLNKLNDEYSVNDVTKAREFLKINKPELQQINQKIAPEANERSILVSNIV